MQFLVLVAAGIQVLSAAALAQTDEDAARAAKRQFRVCQPCHSVEQGGSRGTGPTLYGIFGRKAGTAPDFEYSDAMKKSSIVWSEQTLNQFLANPQGVVPENKMALGAIKDADQRAQLIAYLKTATAAH